MHRRAVLVTVVVALLGALVVAPAVAAGSPPVKLPSSPKGLKAPVTLPKDLDPVPLYQAQVACQPGELPGLRKLSALVLKTYGIGYTGSTARSCTEGTSEHADGRAWDWMVAVKTPKEKAAAADFLAWLTRDGGRNARRLGVMYVIYNETIWGAYRAADGWRASYDHVDHVHVSLSWNGARGNTSFWTGRVQPVDYGPCRVFTGQPAVLRPNGRNLTPCRAAVALVKRTSYPVLQLGASHASVSVAQRRLDVAVTGTLDRATRSAVAAYQSAHDLPRTGTLDQPTWASLVPSRVTSDSASGMTASKARAEGVATYSGTTIAAGSAGRSVLVLQKALGRAVADSTGFAGPGLVTAIKARQKALGRPVTGRWTGDDWAALAG